MDQHIPSLSSAEAAKILKQVGRNELPLSSQGRFLHALTEILKEPMLLLLFLCSGVYLFIGQLHEALLLIISAVFVTLITVAQQFKSEKALESLRRLSSPRASVIRDGREMRVAGTEVVPNDTIAIREGDRIPADAIVLKTEHLEADESLLTGESLPIQKQVSSHVFSGTLIVSGHAIARVTSTGGKTEFGKIGRAIETIQEGQRTAFQKQTDSFVKILGAVAVVFCIFVVLLYGWRMADWPDAILAGLSTAMSMLPEEMPIVVALFLVLGAWRISKHSVLTRKMSAIENLGATTVLCVDKTGTLTENRMVLRTIWPEAPETDEQSVLKTAFAANHSTPFDPMEKAIEAAFLEKASNPTVASLKEWKRAKEYGISKSFLAVSVAWRNPSNPGFWVATKGAPESILSLCKMNPSLTEKILEKANQCASRGQRVLGVAECNYSNEPLPRHQQAFPFRFVGLVGFEDPVRPEVPQALEDCYTAGIRVIIMTGDHPGTAQAVAESIGIRNPKVQVTGHQLESMSDSELEQRIADTNIFARLKPEQKLRLVKALQARGELVSMTGDGINDAPALKAADIGVAMGGRGTDIAREAADLVLLDDNFASIVKAVRLGRRIFENVRNAISYIMAIHVPIAGLAVLPVLLKTPLVLLPPQIVLLEFIIDPTCTFVFEAETEDSNIMKRKPRDRFKKFFGKEQFLWTSLQGLIVLAIVFVAYWWALGSDSGSAHARSLAFTTLIIGNLGLILVNRSGTAKLSTLLHRENRLFQIVTLCVSVCLILLLLIPPLKNIFAFGHLEVSDLGLSFAAGLLVVICAQGTKALRQRLSTA